MNTQTEKLCYTPEELAKVLGVGRNTAYALCHQEDFPARKIGTQYRIPKDGLQAWLNKQGGIA